MTTKQNLIELKEKLDNFIIGDLPDNELEKEIFSELDLIFFNIIGMLDSFFNGKIKEFNLKYEKERLEKIQEYISQEGEDKFRKNKILFDQYTLCSEAIQTMVNYNGDL